MEIQDYEGKIIKITSVGDGAVGKTSLLIRFSTETFPEEYVPTVFDNYDTYHVTDDVRYAISLVDTAGEEDYDEIRQMSYEDVDVILACFSVDNPTSLENIFNKWMPEIRNHCKNNPVIMCGTKSDLESQTDPDVIEKVKKVTGCVDCIITSAKTGENLGKLFDIAVKSHIAYVTGIPYGLRFPVPTIKKEDLESEKGERMDGVLELFGDVNIICKTRNFKIWKSLIHDSSKMPKNCDEYYLKNNNNTEKETEGEEEEEEEEENLLDLCNIDEKIILMYLVDDDYIETDPTKIMELYLFFKAIGLQRGMKRIISNVTSYLEDEDGGRKNSSKIQESDLKLFQQMIKYEKNDEIRNMFQLIHDQQQQQQNDDDDYEEEEKEVKKKMKLEKIDVNTFTNAITLVMFNSLERRVKNFEMSGRMNEHNMDRTFCCTIPFISIYPKKTINPFDHNDFQNEDYKNSNFYDINNNMQFMKRLQTEYLKSSANLVLISTDKKEFLCHKELLVLRLLYFKRMFEFDGVERQAIMEAEENRSDLPKIPIVDCDSEVLPFLLEFVYTQTLEKKKKREDLEVLIKLLIVSQKYVSHELTKVVVERITEITSFRRFGGRVTNNNTYLKELVIDVKLMMFRLGHLLYQNDSVNQYLLPRMENYCGCEVDTKEFEKIMKKSYKAFRKKDGDNRKCYVM